MTTQLSPAERRRAYAVCLLGWLFDFYDLMLFAYVAQAIAQDFHWGAMAAHYKALCVGVALASSGLGGVVFGGLADRYGRRAVMTWTILIYSVFTGLCGLAAGVVSLCVLRALTGIGVGGEWATGHALMAEIFPKEHRGKASALLQMGEPLGVGLAVLAGVWLAPRVGWRAVFFLSAVPAVLVLFVRRHVKESPLWLESAAARKSFGLKAQYATLWRDHRGRAAQAFVLGASKLGTYWLTYVWLPEYFAEMAKAGGGDFSSIRLPFLLTAQACQLLGMLVFGAASDRLGRRPAFTLYSLLTCAGLCTLSLYGESLLRRPEVFWPAMAAVGFGSGCTAGFGALLAELFPTSIRNTAMGAVYNAARAFQFVTQLVMGALAASVGVSHGLLLAAGLALLTASWVWTFPETRGILLEAD